MEYQTIIVEHKDQATWITLNQAEKMNALDVKLASELLHALTLVDNDPNARVLVLQGTGKVFCAGGDVMGFYEHRDEAQTLLSELLAYMNPVAELIGKLNIPVIGGINGMVAGGGFGLALATDIALVSDKAKYTLAYTNIGLAPDLGSSYYLTRAVGNRKALELIMLNEVLTAEQAVELGLANEVVPADNLQERLSALAAKLASGPTKSYAQARKLVQASSQNSLSEHLAMEAEGIIKCSTSEDFVIGVTAFKEKKQAKFSGK